MDIEWKWQQENNELRKALMYYADKKNYAMRKTHASTSRTSRVQLDAGRVARKALEGAGNESIKVV